MISKRGEGVGWDAPGASIAVLLTQCFHVGKDQRCE